MIRKRLIILTVFSVILTKSVQAATQNPENIDWFILVAELFGGLALFLYGMEKMSNGMKKSAGDQMRKILAKLTNNKLIGIGVGAFVTMVIQSSSATTVMLVSFVQSGLMNFTQSLGVILGANIGTTVTAQLIAFKVTDYAIVMIALGFGMRTLWEKENRKTIGEIILGFGLLFFGMDMMSSAMSPLRTYPEFIDFLKQLENPIAGIFVGALFTALVQSSSAFTGIVIVLAQQNLITLEAGIAMIIGSNIGTCVTAGLAGLNATREAKRVALAHSFFNFLGALLFVFFIPWFAKLIVEINDDPARNIANAHTIFNITVALVFIPFTGMFAKLIAKLLPLREADRVGFQTHYLNDSFLTSPVPAIDLAVAEIAKATEVLEIMLMRIMEPFAEAKTIESDKKKELISVLQKGEDELDFLEDEIAEFLIKISRQGIAKKRTYEVFGYLSVINDIESMGDIIYDNLIPLIDDKEKLKKDFSPEGRDELIKYHAKIMKQLKRLQKVLKGRDAIKAIKILVKAEKYSDLETQFRQKHFSRINKGKANTIITHRVHIELFDGLKQLEVFLENIAKTIAETSPFKSEDLQIEEETTD